MRTETVIPPTRDVAGTELPAAGTWRVDPGHAHVSFVGRHLLVAKVRGTFPGVEATIEVGEDPADTTVEVTVDVASVASGNAARDEHLRSPELFDVAQFPVATFRGRAASWRGRAGRLDGELTLKGVTRPVSLDVEYLGWVASPFGGGSAAFTAAGTLDREEWGVSWNLPLDGGGFLVSREIRLEIDLEATYAG